MRLPKCPYLIRKKGIEEVLTYFQREKKTGYARVTLFLENKLFDGIIVFEKGKIIFSYLFYDKKEFFGNDAIDKIMNTDLRDATVDCYEMNKESLELFRKYYPEARVTKEPLPVFVISPAPSPAPPKEKPSREELLKKYKIRVPTEQEISNIILNFFEIDKLKANIKEEIAKELPNLVENIDINLLSHGYFLECDGSIIVNPENDDKVKMIKEKIDKYLDKFSKKLGIDVKNSINIVIGGNLNG